MKSTARLTKVDLGKVHLYTGNGKGKTTAALGLALRAVGAGLRVCFIQFAKPKRSSEHLAISRHLKSIVIKQFGVPGFIRRPLSVPHVREAKKAFSFAATAINSGRYDIVVLDEINIALSLKLIDIKELINILKSRPSRCEIILTGRNAPALLIRYADLVTEMIDRKHYFRSGLRARRGIEH